MQGALLRHIEPRNQDFAINFLIDPFAVFFCQHEIPSAPLAYDYIIKLATFLHYSEFQVTISNRWPQSHNELIWNWKVLKRPRIEGLWM